MSQLNGRVAIVTGGVQGIGLGVSLSLARAGADVVLAEAVEGRIPAAVAEIEALGAQALGVHTDVAQGELGGTTWCARRSNGSGRSTSWSTMPACSS